jgi:decaprenylphospho-beta-D-erythro-pentofuranosid-2-ulose 2-reductase
VLIELLAACDGELSGTLIIGATSAIAEATARRLAARGTPLYLAGRNAEKLAAIVADLRVRSRVRVGSAVLDANQLSAHETMLRHAEEFLEGLDTVIIAHGTLSDQSACQGSVETLLQELTTNALSVVALLTLVANRMSERGRGQIVVISSVAGDRGRASNYVYGSAKALVTTFTSGLRQRLQPRGVSVVTVKPGFVDTPMTAAFAKNALWAQPAAVAAGIVRAMDRKSDVVYLPGFWRPIMWMVRSVPEAIFKRLRL